MPKPIVVYCRSGNRSGMAKTILNQQGINEVYNGGGVYEMLNMIAN
jgi:phage shock protein E